MGRYILNVVCFFLCPDADCLRNNLYGAIKSEFERVLNMNKEWSELNKTMQAQIKKKDTYKRGIDTLLTLRSQLIQTLVSFKEELCREDFNSIPFINADGYHSKTIAYSIWHIFRIEDIVVHTVINEDEQVFFAGNYQERINSPIITTGNELMKQQIADFSKQLNLEELYLYIFEVWESTEKMLERLSYDELKRKIPKERKGYLESLNVVNDNEKAIWLIDYWCNKDICGLIQFRYKNNTIDMLKKARLPSIGNYGTFRQNASPYEMGYYSADCLLHRANCAGPRSQCKIRLDVGVNKTDKIAGYIQENYCENIAEFGDALIGMRIGEPYLLLNAIKILNNINIVNVLRQWDMAIEYEIDDRRPSITCRDIILVNVRQL